ncbi:uncharacterized protein CDV56_109045 [Aspergillus thermomutatus]|uniref:Uncharacterized protein n=1 Tax=Aspergillus thermomutatus TaxID=41047 RepID=A0A397HKZ7_ASPTH|nr:uncharacterized protein CDV56_109045 [Aspergillus thermomutatus]RHZ62034.1 hypothetical protein CDV56_109045 [Aspergillus thermomutatus]
MHGSRSHYDYTVAWISALPLEMAAAKHMFDQIHDRLPQPLTAINTYTLGIVAQMRSTFPRVQYGLLVGIGGGAPSEKVDIRLGDVVVSKPTRTYGGAVQYDYGKTLAGGWFEQTGMLNRPPEILLTAMSKLQADLHYNERPISNSILERAQVTGGIGFGFPYPGQGHNLLFESTYAHVGSDDRCQNCDALHLVPRTARASNEPKVHYGLIASANQVMKDGPTRGMLARNLDILCFEYWPPRWKQAGGTVPSSSRGAARYKKPRGETPLGMVAAGEHDLIIKDLLATNAVDVDAVSMTGQSPLIKAVESYNVPIVRLLLAAGANPNLASKDGKTAYTYAKERSYLRMMAIMRGHGAK